MTSHTDCADCEISGYHGRAYHPLAALFEAEATVVPLHAEYVAQTKPVAASPRMITNAIEYSSEARKVFASRMFSGASRLIHRMQNV
jgi:hypothetical protein